jgi:hypothetical protein
MANKVKNHISGGKVTGNHTTIIDAVASIIKEIEKMTEVTKISLGFITPGLKAAGGNIAVKITDDDNCILLTIKGNTSKQELYIYSENRQKTKEEIAKLCRNKKMTVRFRSDVD